MKLGQRLSVILWPGREYTNICKRNGTDYTHTVNDVTKRVEGIPVMHVGSGRVFA